MDNDTRIKTGFLFLPVTAYNQGENYHETRWLESTRWGEMRINGKWEVIKWIDYQD